MVRAEMFFRGVSRRFPAQFQALQRHKPYRRRPTTVAESEEQSPSVTAATDALAAVGRRDVVSPGAGAREVTSTSERTRSVIGRVMQLSPDDDFVVEGAFDTDGSSPRPVPADAVEIVTDEFAKQREAVMAERRRVLWKLAHPDPLDYTYDGKLVPPPPINFGAFSPQSLRLGHEMFVTPQYKLVRQAPATDYFFELQEHYVEVACVGMANAGKSSLINALFQQRVAKTSTTPHSTRTVNFYQSVTQTQLERYARRDPSKLVKLPGKGLNFTVVDVPGYGMAGMSDAWRDDAIQLTDQYLGLRRGVNTVLMCIDAERGVTATDVKYFKWISTLHGVFYVVVTRADTVPHTRLCGVMKTIYETFMNDRRKNPKFRGAYPFILPVSAMTGANIDQLRALLVETSGIVPNAHLKQVMHAHEVARQSTREFLDPAVADGASPIPALPPSSGNIRFADQKAAKPLGASPALPMRPEPAPARLAEEIGGVSRFLDELDSKPPTAKAAAAALACKFDAAAPWVCPGLQQMTDRELEAFVKSSGSPGKVTAAEMWAKVEVRRRLKGNRDAKDKRAAGLKELHESSRLKRDELPQMGRYSKSPLQRFGPSRVLGLDPV